MLTQLRSALAILLASSTFVFAADNPSAAPASNAAAASTATTTTAQPAAEPVEAELRALVERINTKLKSGATTEAALADELKAFDALLAAHRSEKTDAVANVAVMRAMLYVQVLENFEKGEAMLRAVKTDFPDTEVAKSIEPVLSQLEAQKEMLKVQEGLKPGVAFPDFEEKDLAGAPLSIAKFKGKVVLVDFWATWCGPCVAELPKVLAAYEKFHDKGFEIVGISLDQDEAKLKSFIAERKMTWPQYFDGKGWESKLGQKYGVNSIPATYLLDRDSKIVAKNLRGEALETELAKLLAK